MPRAQAEAVYPKQIEAVIKRNVFCSTCPPIVDKTAETETTQSANLQPQKTSLPLQLLAVNYAAPPGDSSTPASCSATPRPRRRALFGRAKRCRGATLTGIDEARLHLDNAGKPEYLDLLDEVPPPPRRPPRPRPWRAPRRARAATPSRRSWIAGIKKTGEHNYEIQRGTLESVLGNMSLLSRSARIVPEIRDGKAAGFRLYSVRPDGPFAKIGMQNGDVIASINGLEITSPEKALEVYAKLKSASHLSLGLERNGQRITKDYSIR